MIVIDTAPDGGERMLGPVIEAAFEMGQSTGVDVIYLDPDRLLRSSEH